MKIRLAPRLRFGIILASVIALSAATTGCGPKAGSTATVARGPLAATDAETHARLVKEGDDAFALRIDRAQLQVAIERWSAAVALKDDDYQTYEKLARACYLMADGHLYFERETNEDAFFAMYERGYTAAARGLQALSPALEKQLKLDVDLGDAVGNVGKDGVGLMYWYATNLGKWSSAHDDIMVVLKYKDRIVKIMSRVTELDPTFFYGAPDRYWGAFYSIAPAFAGGDLDKAYTYFQASLKIAPNYLATYNLIVENYAAKRNPPDKKMFMELTQRVLDAPADIMPGFEAETAAEKRKAEYLRKRVETGDIVF